jgi:hypothetical protein
MIAEERDDHFTSGCRRERSAVMKFGGCIEDYAID